MKIIKGDNIIVISGKDKGKRGKVLKAIPSKERLIVEGINVSKRHQRSRQQGKKGEIIDIPMPISISNVALIDPKNDKATKVTYKVDGKKKVRIAKSSGQTI